MYNHSRRDSSHRPNKLLAREGVVQLRTGIEEETMATRFVPTAVRSGLEALATERERTLVEQDAFETFRTHVTAIDPPEDGTDGAREQRSDARRVLVRRSRSGKRLQRVREAYRESVMTVSHYEEEYDDSLAESLAEEFGPDVAGAVMTGDRFARSLREQLLAASRQACTRRRNFRTVLTRETEALQAAEGTITTLGAVIDTLDSRSLESWSSADLTDAHNRLLTAEERCEELASDRQATLRSRGLPGPTPVDIDHDLAEYLYQSLSVTYPVLADITDLAETLQTERRRVERALGRY